MPVCTIQLTQYTPLLHFQGSTPDATLRATEVKPKLDRFLCAYAIRNVEKVHSSWLVGGAKAANGCYAFDYKMSIQADDIDSVPVNNVGCAFQLGQSVQGKLAKNGVTVTFRSRHKGLIKAIKEWGPCFFAVTNFARRQNKGFGSFLPVGMGEKEVKAEIKRLLAAPNTKYMLPNVYHAELGQGECISPLNKIKALYANMVTGSTNPSVYGYLTSWDGYPSTKGLVSIKNHRAPQEKKRFYRAMLGLPYRYQNTTVWKPSGIQRFQSPLTFKPVKFGDVWHVYVFLQPVDGHMFGKSFTIGQRYNTPSKDEFDLVDFMDHCATKGWVHSLEEVSP